MWTEKRGGPGIPLLKVAAQLPGGHHRQGWSQAEPVLEAGCGAPWLRALGEVGCPPCDQQSHLARMGISQECWART